MKKFCILEQGNTVGEKLTTQKKALFSGSYCDFFRLNWCRNDDPQATFHKAGIVWSEGRSFLFKQVPKNYEYYIFIDDDVSFHCDQGIDLVKEICRLLDYYSPLAATFYTDLHKGGWHFNRKRSRKDYLKRDAFPIAGFDLCAHVFSASFAKVMFPVTYHGSEKSMRYAQWACNQLYPLKQICFTTVRVKNNRGEPHQDYTNPQFNAPHKLIRLFNKHVRHSSPMPYDDVKSFKALNNIIFNSSCDSIPVEFKLSDLDTIYDTSNDYFKKRTAISTTNSEKMLRRSTVCPKSHYFIHHGLKCVYVVNSKAASRSLLYMIGFHIPEIQQKATASGLDILSDQRIIQGSGSDLECIDQNGDLLWERRQWVNSEEMNYFFFSFVRHPVARLVSAYDDFYLSRNKPLIQGGDPSLPLASVIDFACNSNDNSLNRYLTSQSYLCCYSGSRPLDFTGKMENFDSDWKHLAKVLNLNPGFVKLNTQSIHASVVTEKHTRQIERRYLCDMENFDYALTHKI